MSFETDEASAGPEPIRARLARDRFAALVGLELLEVRPGYAKMQLDVGPNHLNALGLAHGGAIFTLAATTFFAACNAAGQEAVGIHMNIACLQPSQEGRLTAEAREISRSRRLAACEVQVTDSEGVLIAQFQGTAYVKKANAK